MPVRRFALFRTSTFNTTETKDYFINPGCFGDDAARWFIAELARRGIKTDPEPGQEDFGWFMIFEFHGLEFNLLMGFREADEHETEGNWLLWIERAGILNAILRRSKQIPAEVAMVVHGLLATSPIIRDVRWFEEADTFEEHPFPAP